MTPRAAHFSHRDRVVYRQKRGLGTSENTIDGADKGFGIYGFWNIWHHLTTSI